jgi:fused signal recognition particle receptor
MARWFRRKGQDRDKSPDGETLPPEELEQLEEEPETSPPPAPEELSITSESAEESPIETESPPPEPRRGFFARFRKGRRAEEELQPSEEEQKPPVIEAELPRPCSEVTEPEKEISEAPAEKTSQVISESAEEYLGGLEEQEAVGPEVAEGWAEEGSEEEEAAEGAEAAEPAAEGRGMFRRLRARLSRTREVLSGGLDRLLLGRKEVDAALLDELEELLITADLGVETTLFLVQALQEKLKRRELGDVDRLKAVLKDEMVALLQGPPPREISSRPWVTLLVGINGVGKTTTIAKLANRDRRQGLAPLLVAADTFRAAAVEQLEIWGERVGAQVVKQKTGSDPAAVVFDGLTAALSRGVDTVYVDTAGRLHTKVNLMEELKKIFRTAAKKIPDAPHDVILVLDATTGQNALSQARLFHEAVGLTGIILTKMDGTAKGGVALAVAHETGIPLRYIGVGEGMEDLRPFDAEAFVAAILE